MPVYFTAKEERQYQHIQKSCRTRGGTVKGCKRIAAATVNKQRAKKKGICTCPVGYNKTRKKRGEGFTCRKRGKPKTTAVCLVWRK